MLLMCLGTCPLLESLLARRLGWDDSLSESQCLSLVNQMAAIRRTEVSLRSNSLRGGNIPRFESLPDCLAAPQHDSAAAAPAAASRDVAAGECAQRASSTALRVDHGVRSQTSSGQNQFKSQVKMAESLFVADQFLEERPQKDAVKTLEAKKCKCYRSYVSHIVERYQLRRALPNRGPLTLLVFGPRMKQEKPKRALYKKWTPVWRKNFERAWLKACVACLRLEFVSEFVSEFVFFNFGLDAHYLLGDPWPILSPPLETPL